jgi:pimeloyl-ACP methyl ester carboxylesterase
VSANGRFVAFDGVEIAYRDYGGHGDGLVLLHGIGGNLESMDALARLLGVRRHVVSLDVRCCGQSGDAGRFSLDDAATDVETLLETLGLGSAAVVGASMGGVIAGYYGARHPDTAVVSIDGFAAGTLPHRCPQEAEEFATWAAATRTGLEQMTAPPETGDEAWMDEQVERALRWFDQLQYGSAHPETEARRNFVALGGGRFRRHPARNVLDDQLADASRSMIHMFEACSGPVLVIYCMQAGWPVALERELEELASSRPNLVIRRLNASHLAPVWREAATTATIVQHFLDEVDEPRSRQTR